MTRRTAPGILALALAASLSGCGLVPLDDGAEEPAPTTTSAPSSTSATPTPTPTVDEFAKERAQAMVFDEEYCEWDNGVVVTASMPKRFTPSAQADPANGVGTPMRLTVVVVNKSGEPYPVDTFSATLYSGGQEAVEILDPVNKLEGPPTGTLANGAQVKVPLGFYVADPNDILLKVAPGLDCDWAYFTG